MATIKTIDQFPFVFYDETFYALLASDRRLYVPLHDMCQALGVQAHGQVERIRSSAVSDALVELDMLRDESNRTIRRQMVCLRLDRLPFWLGTLQPNRIQDETRREYVIQFQREFADVAWAAFRREILPDDILAEMEAQLPPAEQEYLSQMDEAADLRRSIQEHEAQIQGMEERLGKLEARLVGTDFINPAQMKQYLDMVGLIAMLLKKRNKGNQATVHAEVKRQFRVPSYQLIPEADFDDVKRFMASWYQRLSPPGAPLPAIFESPSQKRLF